MSLVEATSFDILHSQNALDFLFDEQQVDKKLHFIFPFHPHVYSKTPG